MELRCRVYIFPSRIIQLSGAKVSSVMSFSSVVEHIELLFVGVVELSRAYSSGMELNRMA